MIVMNFGCQRTVGFYFELLFTNNERMRASYIYDRWILLVTSSITIKFMFILMNTVTKRD